MNLIERNDKIIDAIIRKAEKVCPGSLVMIGINGSFMTGDFYEKSDLDLLILIRDENGWKLADTFIQDDLQVGFDLYCTDWAHMEKEAEYTHPNISKLMDAKIVYCPDAKDRERLEALRLKVHNILQSQFSQEDWKKADTFIKEAEHCYTEVMIGEDEAEARLQAGYVINRLTNAAAMLNKTYFRYGVKRTYEEIQNMKKRPEDVCSQIEAVITAGTLDLMKIHLTALMKEMKQVMKEEAVKLASPRKKASQENLSGTYEEMYSNWKNKMHHAVTLENRYLSYMSMASFQNMLDEISDEIEINKYRVFVGYQPGNLEQMVQSFELTLQNYQKEYDRAGKEVEHYPDINTFIAAYLNK